MSKIERVTPEQLHNSIDNTVLKDCGMPKVWKCPHCGRQNKTSKYAEGILLENLLYLEHCGCGYVHSWELELSEDFKKKVVEMLMCEARKAKNCSGE